MNRIFSFLAKIFALLITVFVFGLINYLLISASTKDRIYDDIDEMPNNRTGLLLGTSKYLINGHQNLYYKYRLDAAKYLIEHNKIKIILVSGDNSTIHYNEPTTIKSDLIKMGIPEDNIFLDYAGLRTLDSVVRCKEIFGQDNVTIISQKFHNQRALFLAQNKGLSAIAFNTQDVQGHYGMRSKLREYFARIKMMMDLILGVSPKYLGEVENID